ncbi:hypothetical protein FGO68_gene16305 [Halteria grandinella]|uniref:Uncharacterized protein n=1 Tax=Halteria grandinella TaxID=5974 RepID=A0A8J8NZ63_HALGN|nr:hypothetical protein FGO68_gene16305 [Halteria grandinella]
MVKHYRHLDSDVTMQHASKARGGLRNHKRSKSSSNERMLSDPKQLSNRVSFTEEAQAKGVAQTLEIITSTTDRKDLKAYLELLEALGADLAHGATLTSTTIVDLHSKCRQQLTDHGEHFIQTKLPFASVKKTVAFPMTQRVYSQQVTPHPRKAECTDSEEEDSDESTDEPRVKLYSTSTDELFDSQQSDFSTTPVKSRSKPHKAPLGISKNSHRLTKIKHSLFKVPRVTFPKAPAKKDDMTCLIERIASLHVAEEQDDSEITLIFFLRETLEFQFEHLLKEVKKCFFFTKDLRRLEVYNTNHMHLIIGKVYSAPGITHGILKAKSSLFTTEFGSLLFSKQLKGTFKVYDDLMTLNKIKDLITY